LHLTLIFTTPPFQYEHHGPNYHYAHPLQWSLRAPLRHDQGRYSSRDRSDQIIEQTIDKALHSDTVCLRHISSIPSSHSQPASVPN